MIQRRFSLELHWPTLEPFLFCAHHKDFYPRGTPSLGPEKKYLEGRDLGMDFTVKDGFRMYHGYEIPGFPVHPHRGFETVTIVRRGYVDHADSLGAAGRYGEGDVQWMTAGAGVQHSEMFPLLKQDEQNTTELFQIWLNLPKRNKAVPPHYKMFWAEDVPRIELDGEKVKVSLIAGTLSGVRAIDPPPNSWAADPENEVLILVLKLSEGGRFVIPRSNGITNRALYFFEGEELEVAGERIGRSTGLFVQSQVDLWLSSPRGTAEVLLLQAKPIGETIVQQGPFVMNSREDILQTLEEYRRTEFGGWPWPRNDMVHGPVIERFAKFPDGRIEKPKG